MKPYVIKLTDEQVTAVNSAFPDSKVTFSDKLRSLIEDGLALRNIEMPDTPQHGGKRQGAGRKYKRDGNQ